MKPKKFVLFMFNEGCAQGGIDDVAGSYDTLSEAEDKFNQYEHIDHRYILERDTWKVVLRTASTKFREEW